jgi:hypothetical protein
MNEKWNQHILDYIKRTGEEIKGETQRILEEIRNPENQQKVRDRLNEFGAWAKQTADEAASLVETAVKTAESAFVRRANPTRPHKKSVKSRRKPPRRPTRSRKP